MPPWITDIKFLAKTLPLELFSFFGSFVEEIFSPIPSPLILMTAGSLAGHRHHSLLYLILLSLFASAGKTLAAYLYYFIADKLEDIILKKFGKFLDITHAEVESVGAYFNGTAKDDLILILARAIPPVPTTIVSVACGLFKINPQTFVRSTFIGYFIRCFIFLYLGYSGFETYESLSLRDIGLSTYLQIGLFLIPTLFIIWIFTPSGRKAVSRWLPKK